MVMARTILRNLIFIRLISTTYIRYMLIKNILAVSLNCG